MYTTHLRTYVHIREYIQTSLTNIKMGTCTYSVSCGSFDKANIEVNFPLDLMKFREHMLVEIHLYKFVINTPEHFGIENQPNDYLDVCISVIVYQIISIFYKGLVKISSDISARLVPW